ncbi:MAG: phospho-N-acetylmuramoyl-pentapeptide-transferase [Lachnospiraceae bacterium]|nr:phospho-N-acetylmuramoyl-pentapeptide-transferase [Lachnospiraceae bacterium]
MQTGTILSVLVSFGISVILCPVIIPFLKRLKFGQNIREEGPKDHLKKMGTPTMGGLIILFSILITSMGFIEENRRIIPVLFVTLGFGLIGFLDDYIKIVMKRSLGLKPMQKMGLQIIVTAIFAYYIVEYSEAGTGMLLPFTGGIPYGAYIEVGSLFVPMLFFAVLGTVNGANFTDGLDGLVTGVTIIIAVFYTVVSHMTGAGIETITGAVAGSLLGFLLFNVYPARVFMGDTGSLALGGFVVASAYMMNLPIFLLIIAFIYMIEVLSVIIQVTYFKLTKGKRIFKMAPIHHHFELYGWSETRVVTVFSTVTAIMCLIAYLAL